MKPRPINETRRNRLLEYLKGFKRDVDASAKLGIAPGYLSQLKMGLDNGGRNIGERLARKMEQSAGLPFLWLDGTVESVGELSDDEEKLIRRFRRINSDAQQRLLGWLAIERTITFTGDYDRLNELDRTVSVHEQYAEYEEQKK